MSREDQTCDQCNGTFPPDQLDPTSGDWWICAECWKKTHQEMTEINALRTALEVAVREIVATRKEREAFFDNSRYDVWKDSVKRAGETSVATDANPIASAAIKKAREGKQ